MRGDIRNQLPSLDSNFEIPPHHSPKDGWTPEQSPENTDLNPWENVTHRQSFAYTRGNGQTVTATVSGFEDGKYIITFPIGRGNTMAESLTPEKLQKYLQDQNFSETTYSLPQKIEIGQTKKFPAGKNVEIATRYGQQESDLVTIGEIQHKDGKIQMIYVGTDNNGYTKNLQKGEIYFLGAFRDYNHNGDNNIRVRNDNISDIHCKIWVKDDGSFEVSNWKNSNGTYARGK